MCLMDPQLSRGPIATGPVTPNPLTVKGQPRTFHPHPAESGTESRSAVSYIMLLLGDAEGEPVLFLVVFLDILF